ncbi:MAG: hydrogenase nickel incorporation protein HypA [Candidatus Bathyarchaeia archaeon]
MHEWALAEAIISAVSEVADKENFKEVKSVLVLVGELQQVDREVLKFAITQLRPDKLAKTRFIIRVVRASFTCKACGHKWPFRESALQDWVKEAIHFVPEVAHAYIRCPVCGSPDFEISGGRGVWIAGIRGEK